MFFGFGWNAPRELPRSLVQFCFNLVDKAFHALVFGHTIVGIVIYEVIEGLMEAIDMLQFVARKGDKEAIVRGLRNLIPEYRPPQLTKQNDQSDQKVVLRPTLHAVAG